MNIDEAPISEKISSEKGLEPVWQKWFSSLSDLLSGDYHTGEIGLDCDYQPNKSNVLIIGNLCAVNFEWLQSDGYPNTEFEITIPRNNSRPYYFVDSVLPVLAITYDGLILESAEISGETITMPAIENATKVVLNGNLFLERI